MPDDTHPAHPSSARPGKRLTVTISHSPDSDVTVSDLLTPFDAYLYQVGGNLILTELRISLYSHPVPNVTYIPISSRIVIAFWFPWEASPREWFYQISI